MSQSVYEVNCPQCLNEIEGDRILESTIVCNHCGWVSSREQQIQEAFTSYKFIKITMLLAIFMVSGFIHLVQWDRHFVSILPLKIAALTGIADKATYLEMADICKERMKHGCTEASYAAIVKLDPLDLETLQKLAKLQSQTQQFEKSIATYNDYFTRGGRETEAAYQFARLLEHTGKIADADRYYLFALAQKPNTLQITVSLAYVKFLMKHSRYQQAKRHIDVLRRKGAPPNFLSEEYKQISSLLRRHT